MKIDLMPSFFLNREIREEQCLAFAKLLHPDGFFLIPAQKIIQNINTQLTNEVYNTSINIYNEYFL